MPKIMEEDEERAVSDALALREEMDNRRDFYIIREIYDAENPYENFEQQLERALAQEYPTIVIEPFRLGDETSRWIAVGNWLHKTAVLSGFGSLIASFVWSNSPVINVPLAVVSGLCTGLYSLSWQNDPCCKYQVESDPKQINQLALQSLNNSSPVVLVRKDDYRRKVLHSAVTAACLTQIGLRYYYPSIYRIFSPAYTNSAVGHSSTSSGEHAGKIVVTNYSRHSPSMVPTSSTSTGFMSVLAEGVEILKT